MSAETLRRAASLIRERAEACLPFMQAEGGWWEEMGLLDAFDALTGNADEPLYGAGEDAVHIASWHPAVALAVADWLDDAAETEELMQPGGELGPQYDQMFRRIGHQRALAVARAYLGEQP